MTRQEAIDKVTLFPGWNKDDEWLKEDEMNELTDKIIKALEKQIPKKMINYSCPLCNHYFEDGDTKRYCPNCGQRIERMSIR